MSEKRDANGFTEAELNLIMERLEYIQTHTDEEIEEKFKQERQVLPKITPYLFLNKDKRKSLFGPRDYSTSNYCKTV